MNSINQRIKELIEILNNASYYYYNTDKSIMLDKEWDLLFDELKKLEEQTGIIYSNSPTQNAGYLVADSLPKLKHSTPLLSLDKTKSIDELEKWLGNQEGILMAKMDGCTGKLQYNEFVTESLSTRGSSATNEGQDISHNINSINNIPNRINKRNLQIIGEMIIEKHEFEEINKNKEYKNARNFGNASTTMLDSSEVAKRKIQFIPFNILECEDFKTKSEQFEWLKLQGFKVVDYEVVNRDNLKKSIEKWIKNKDNYNFEIDGLVLAYNDVAYGEKMGKTSHHFKNAIAYKFCDESADTTLLDIVLDIGKSGQASYTAIFEPVELDGTTVERATLHNYEYIESLQLGIGDTIRVIKANMIIPQVIDNLTRSGTFKKVETCPICGGKLVHRDGGVHQFCENYYCDKQVVERLVHWCSRDVMNIEGLSEETIKKIREIKLNNRVSVLNSFADIYAIPKNKEALIKLNGFGKRKVEKLCEAIEKSKSMPLSKIIYGLSIPQVGRKASKLLGEYFKDAKILLNYYDSLDRPDLLTKVQDLIGESAGESFLENFYDDKIISIMDLLISYGLTMKEELEKKSNKLEGKVFVITGSVEFHKNRKELEARIESFGGKTSGSVSVNTSFLINNDKDSNSSKNKLAKELGVPIISEEEFLKIIK